MQPIRAVRARGRVRGVTPAPVLEEKMVHGGEIVAQNLGAFEVEGAAIEASGDFGE